MKKRFHFLVTLPALLLLGCTLFFLFLPNLLDLYLFPRLLKELPFTEKELSLSRLSPWKIRGTLTLADGDRPTFSIPKFELYYTPSSLLRGEIAGLLLDSASLQIEMQNGQPVIRGLAKGNPSTTQQGNTSSFLLPLAVDNIIVKNCAITFVNDLQKPIRVIANGHFALDFLEQADDKKLLSALSGQIQVRGDLTFNGKIGLKAVDQEYELQLQLQAPDIGQLAMLIPGLKDIQPTGSLSLNGRANIDALTNRITGYQATLTLPGLQLKKNNFIVENSSGGKPVTLKLNGNPEKAKVTLANLALIEPEKATVDFESEVNLPAGTFNTTGNVYFAKTNSGVTIKLSGDHQLTKTSMSYELAGDAFTLGDDLSFSSFAADGNITLDGSSIAAVLNSRIPEITLKKTATSLKNLSLHIPFHNPPLTTAKPGTLTIDEIRYQGVNSGKLKATVLPSAEKIAFTTLLTTPFVPNLKLSCDGSAQATGDFSAHCRIPETGFDSASMPSFLALPDKLTFKGKLAAVGEFQMSDKVPAGNLTINLSNGTLSHGENRLSDIKLGIVFPHLPLLQSSPGQLCTIGALDLGKIKMSDARIRFRVEDNQSIFFENIRLSWCGGKVETGSFTLAQNMKELETTLYCDRLGFTELLGQFGIDKTEGQGSLNGRIPMIISKQGVVFDDGFLFSTPGNGGIVRFNDTEQLRQGIPDANRSAYLDYSMKALENFAYNWTKLSFNSQKNDLLIAMQLDGKPAEPLAFGYKNGQIVPNNKGPGLQHPIRLDVNFRLPMQDLFKYGKNIQSIMENM